MVNKFAHLTGGADRNCLGLIRLLAERGHEVEMLSTAGRRNVVSDGAFVKLRVTAEGRGRLSPRQRVDVALRALWNPDSARSMRQLIARFKPDVVHTHKLYPQISAAPVVIAARAGLPVVQTLHDYEFLSASQHDDTGSLVDRDETQLSYRVLNTATFPVRRGVYARRVRAFIACSRFLADRYRTKRGIDATVLPYFVDPPPDALPEFSQRDGAIFLGRLHEEKGVHDVIRLAELLPDLRVAVVGFGPLEDTVIAADRRLPNLEFLGRRDGSNIKTLLESARVSLMPSRWQEPGGIAALEAMSAGTPVIAYANGGLAEYVSDTGGGRAIEPTASALAHQTQVLHEDEKQWHEYSKRGVAGVARLHSPDSYVSRLEAIYESAISRSSDPAVQAKRIDPVGS